ncbi:hydroxycinnamoyl-CoA shikimate/quinate hydroxycinnamoyl transferase [Perilla frutescens var. hirtella]|nr:hydroxycinnamoyl-CoA shikimate/quinate hydroxycinnamoyl transferase [Perilla frutescens var. hirtella]
MKIVIKESMMIKPMEETPSGSLWLSSLDLVMPDTYHTLCVYFYRSDGSAGADFFDAAVLKAALSRALVEFYPYAGRLKTDDNGRIEINCNCEGVFFSVAECDGTIDDLGGFSPRPDIRLVPIVDYSQGISTFPLLLLQLTRFKCGGVSIGVANEHHVSDGISGVHFMDTWSLITRGLTPTVRPFLDRRFLSARNPPQPQFPHIEHRPPPSLKTDDDDETSFSTFRLSRHQLNALKQKCNDDDDGKHSNYTSYEVVTGHVWRCVCMARRLPGDQETKLQLPVNGRPRLKTQLPPGFFGNGIFYTAAFALCGELESKPLRFAVGKVHEAIVRMDDEYLRSALDYLELQQPNFDGVRRSERNVKYPNFGITSWVRLPTYKVDFGWGKPAYVGPGAALFEGKSFLVADPQNEGGVLLLITLRKQHMKLFQNLLYDIDDSYCCVMSKI